MEPKSETHLAAARRNRDLARALIDPTLASLRPAPWEWVAVIAFYAAVHFINAYLWETARREPSSHPDRLARVRREGPLRQCRRRYLGLQVAAQDARYEPTFALSEQEARVLVEDYLRYVEATVMAALGLPAPTW